MKRVCITVGLGHPRSYGWTVNALNSSNLQSVKGRNSNWIVFSKMLCFKSKHRACTTMILARTAETWAGKKKPLNYSFGSLIHQLLQIQTFLTVQHFI